MSAAGALSWTGVVLLVVSVVLGSASVDQRGKTTNATLSAASWTAFGLAATVFIAAAWAQVLS